MFAGRIPAAGDLVGIYEDVGTVLITLSTSSVPSFKFPNLCIQGVGDERYPNIPRVYSVRTEDLPAGLLHEGEPPLSLYGAYGKPAPPNMQRIQAWIKTVGAARVVRTTSFQFELSTRGQGLPQRKIVR